MWYFMSPQIVYGEGALCALDELRGRRALVVTDPTVAELGLTERVTSHLAKAGVPFVLFDEVEPDPSLETARRGARVALDHEPDWIVAIGGGSVIDAAKAIWVLYERPDLDPAEINPVSELGLRKKARLVTVPTTSGTGAEATWAIILTDTEDQRKLSLGNRENMADIAIVDPELVMGMPPRLTADTGLDALTHAVEGYTCTWHTDMTDGLCLQAAQMVLEYLPRAVSDGNDAEAREKMHVAATLAGLGFGNSLASMAHAMGHALGAALHVPHGRAVGLLLPYSIEYIAAEESARYARLARFLGLGGGNEAQAASGLVEGVRGLCHAISLPTSIADLDISRPVFEAALAKLVDDASNDASLFTSARVPSYGDLDRLFRCAYDGDRVEF